MKTIENTHFIEADLFIIREGNCPLYKRGDILKLSGNSLSLPQSKPTCIILVNDITHELAKHDHTKNETGFNFECSGCGGSIQLECKIYKKDIPADFDEKDEKDFDETFNFLNKHSLFETLNKQDINDLMTRIQLKEFNIGDTIISKGDSGENLFIVVSGRVEVLGDKDIRITHLEAGEIFGEMSILTGDPVGATIKVVEPSKIFYWRRMDFMYFINKFPSLQLYLLGLLVRRLAKVNIERSEDLSLGLFGNLTAFNPSGLFQFLNFVQKTGKLTLELSQGIAEVSFRDGELIGAKYKYKKGEEAFYEILKEQEGRFKYKRELSEREMEAEEIGDFMGLMMEGLRKIDEEENNSMS